jgi:hypothetical protein
MSEPLDPVLTLLRAVRRRRWLAQIERHTRYGIAGLGAAALVLGAVHRWLWPLPTVMALTVVALPLVASLCWSALRGRPSLADCARLADRALHGRELFATAWEIRGAADTTEGRPRAAPGASARDLVVALASDEARRRSKALPSFRERGFGLRLPLALAGAGVFLLLNPGAPSTPSLTEGRAAPERHATEPLSAPQPVARARAASDDRVQATADSSAPALPDDDQRTPKPLLLPETGRARPSGSETGQLPAAARAATRPEGNQTLPELQLTLAPIASIDSAAQRAAGVGGVELDAAAPGDAELAVGPSNLAGAAQGETWNRLRPTERHYVATYFAARSAVDTQSRKDSR